MGTGAPFAHSYGSQNTFVGQGAGNFFMTGFGDNTASGAGALQNNTTGAVNTASGWEALFSNTTGNSNTASGVHALFSNTTGNLNTASGMAALLSNTAGNSNTASGRDALLSNTTGNSNTASGQGALYSNTTGGSNTAVGLYAGVTGNFANANTTGSNNTFLGFQAGPGTPTQLTNATAIRANALVSASNAMVLGDGTVRVGIGTQTPIAILEVKTATAGTGLRVGVGTGGILASFGGSGDFQIDAFGVIGGRLVVKDSTGNVGIGTPAPDNLLTVNGTADKPGGGSWATFSDGRLKTVNGSFRAGLDAILKLSPVRYRYKEQNALGIKDHDEHIGFVAQDVEKVIPEAVSKNSQGYRLVNNDPILWTMLNAIKEQEALIRKQKTEGQGQQAEIEKQRAQIRKLTRQVQEMQKVQQQMAALEARLARVEVGSTSNQASAATRLVSAGNLGGGR